ncbi:tripartite tricarboxylate transporter TctB family protein [Luethyella okanaganae]|uniref:Tripartite tricarboxylate transporter TctB family protein n=1 Tax=Luethyella okanaganae TaxID=69372 RepID=A0ABW1VER0_9MICO
MTRLRSLMRGRSELGLAALLGALAIVVAIDTANIRHTAVNAGVMGPQVVPTIIAVGLGACAVALAIDVLRGGHGAAEDGEDVDLEAGAHWPTLLCLAGLILLTALLIEPLGFVIATSLLFYGSALLLGSRRYIIALLIGIVLAVLTFYGFVLGLGIGLPAGLLTGIL